MKWSFKRFTFVVIPDANGSVKRINLPAVVVILIPILFVLLILSVIYLYLLYSGNIGSISTLQTKLADSSSQYEKILADKNNNIDTLQTQVVSLSEKAQSIQKKLEEVNELETQVKNMVGLKTSDTSKKTPTGAAIEDGDPQDGGVGGEDIPVTDAEITSLLNDTLNGLAKLDPAVEEMKSRLESTKSEIAKEQAKQKKIPTIWPTDSRRITSQYGVRKDPFTGSARFHAGIDIGGSTGDPIYAAADGVVVHSGKDDAEGNNITVDHGNGIRTRYMHMSKLIAKVGDKVTKGEVIGELGSTGRSTGPHLHYEVLVNGDTTDPMAYIN
ncbi:peptidoglycan DD-metalloendopeptidase family protein [Cohnella lubricantis]|uniref:Peptidoglycan DD-metalloendopeptidase family protein n=1 Tax=Cohnella lubricantis TaxID=2163172 RepID=A0A841TL70_9BACL|nr:peptidoglycan DD-metalloendopeptidase family protein [Cohnella lubricantis]MBB6679291.1 peptidoglycan DD-metalloendopeptidase family protein [Cohnella lubricantis]MBP2120400.1 murein DD-endopeptidase MepM/ murein hydrolase activator NlpD [Cohnella lubricantis]